MRIAIIAVGGRGDVQPYIALGQGLKKAGHTVRLVTMQDFEALVKAHELEFWSVRGNAQEALESQEMRELLEKGNLLKVMGLIKKESQRTSVEWMEDGLAACQGVDLLITGSLGLNIGIALADYLKIPFIRTHLVPFTPTRTFPSAFIPQILPNLGGTFNLLSWQFVLQMLWLGVGSIFNQARKKVLGLPPTSFVETYLPSGSKSFPTLYGFSSSVVPVPADWSADNHVTGYWFLDPADDWSPPPALLDFLQVGSPPVYFGFGSMSSRNPQETAELVLKALKKTNQRALLFSGWGGLQKKDLPDSVMMIDSTPHSWLFPRLAAVVHHGGAGTTAAGLRAGVPSIVIPFNFDQPFWGQRVYKLGVGPAPIPRSKLTVDRLAHAIQESVTNTAMRQRAAELGAKIQAEDGVANAIEIIQ
jgi:UDP:flavonoid glycosyltransferase YjiC (YdhE family)